MDRRALLLYLQNVRDLEVVRARISRDKNKALAPLDREISSIQTEAYLQEKPLDDAYGFWVAVYAILSLLTLWPFIASLGWLGDPSKGGRFMAGVFVAPFAGLFLLYCVMKVFTNLSAQSDYDSKVAEINSYNKAQTIKAKEGKAKVEELTRQRKRTNEMYKREYNQVKAILDEFYSMNIIPDHFRYKLASIVYIYDYMSSSQATLKETLYHTHMEDGIQRLERKMDEVISRISELIGETRCMRAENRAYIERTIGQNERMLEQLESISVNTQEAAQYAYLAAEYNKANELFSTLDIW